MDNVATYSEARSEYTKQLASFVVPAIVRWFQEMWSRNSKDKAKSIVRFQSDCEEIPRWNQDRIQDEVRVLLDRMGCDYMEELMTAVFVAHTKVLTAVRLSSKQKKLSITVPKLDHFLHRIFRESARCFWKSAFLFMEVGTVIDQQKNVLQMEALASEAITAAVRSLLPVKQILQDYLGDDEEEVEEVDETEAETVEPVVPPAVPVAQTVEAVVPPAVPVAQTVEAAVSSVPLVPVAPPAVPVAPVVPVAPPAVPVVPVAPPAVPVAQTVEAVTPVAPVEPTPLPLPPHTASISNEPPTTSVVKIDTEPAVHFAEYNTVFQPGSEPTMKYVGLDDVEEDEGIHIDESSEKPLEAVEDLDAPVSSDALEYEVLE